jgi:hypothetical protein
MDMKPHEYEASYTIALKCYVHISGKSEEKWEGIIMWDDFETGSPKVLSTIHVPSFVGNVNSEQKSDDFYVIPNMI